MDRRERLPRKAKEDAILRMQGKGKRSAEPETIADQLPPKKRARRAPKKVNKPEKIPKPAAEGKRMKKTASKGEGFTKVSNTFAAELYQKIIEGKTGNVIISPASVQSAVTLAMFGANGYTKAEMLSGLKYPAGYSDETIAKNFESFTAYVNKNGLKIANKVYVMKNFSVKKSFQDVAAKSFASEAQSLDFSRNVASSNTINKWVEEKTNNKIKDLVKPDMLNADTRIVLVNAIYFKAFWKYQFHPRNSFKAPFHFNEVDTVEVDFMKHTERFKYGLLENLDASAIELPYENSNISMLIILPNKKTGLAALESKLHTIDLADLSTKMNSQNFTIKIPKFKIEFDIELNEPLQKLGMHEMFDIGADFTGLLNSDEPLRWVSKVVHKAFIEVNEAGTEAAAATRYRMIGGGGPPQEFFARQPFVFMIKVRDISLFVGRIEKP